MKNVSLDTLLKKPELVKLLSQKQKDFLLPQVDAFITQQQAMQDRLKKLDPFWYYEPSDGSITGEGVALLNHFLKPEDIPQGTLDSQKDFHCSTAETRGTSGGNQSGKSTSMCIDDFIEGLHILPMSMRSYYPTDKWVDKKPFKIRVTSVDYTTLLNTILPTYKFWCPKDYLIGGDWDKSYKEEGKDGQRILKLGNWKKDELICQIEFMTNAMEVKKFQGPPLDKVDYDEEPRQDIYKENLLRFTTAKRFNQVFAFTPTNGLSWATDLFGDEGLDDKTALFRLCSVTNKSANLEVLQEILGKIGDYNEIKMRLLGEFISLSGLVYGRLFGRMHVIPPFHASPEDYVVILGLDPHLVTPTAAVFLALDREGNKYVLDSYMAEADTEIVKADICKIFSDNGWRWGWSVADKSSNTSIMAFGGLNIFKTLQRQPNAIKALRTSNKFEGSIKAGVDEIKKDLKINEKTSRPSFFICDTPNNKPLINAMKTMERDTYANEDKSGEKDRIREGKHHLHAALRYIYQNPLIWYPAIDYVPQFEQFDEVACW